MSKQVITVIVGSKNPVKVNAIKKAIQNYYPQAYVQCDGIDAPSLVAEQPITSTETRMGAVNRLHYCKAHYNADFYAAIEGGVDMFEEGAATFAFIALATNEQISIGRSAHLPLPLSIFKRLEAGEELGPLMDELFNTTNIKQQGGAIGLLTQGRSCREENYVQAATLAMAPLLNPQLYYA